MDIIDKLYQDYEILNEAKDEIGQVREQTFCLVSIHVNCYTYGDIYTNFSTKKNMKKY